MSRRVDRINGVLRQEISQLLSRQIKDPRLNAVVTITQVQTSSDLRTARVFLSVLGDPETRQKALEGIQSAATFLRRELRGRLTLRYTPFLTFVLDDSLEHADHLLSLMDRIQKESPPEESQAGGQPPDGQPYEGPLFFPTFGG